MIIGVITCFAVGIICIIIGIMNMHGNISTLHSYHRKRVSEADIIPFGREVGIGMLIVGGAIILSGILYAVSYFTETKILDIVSTVVALVGTAVGTGFAFHAMIKYNKGIF